MLLSFCLNELGGGHISFCGFANFTIRTETGYIQACFPNFHDFTCHDGILTATFGFKLLDGTTKGTGLGRLVGIDISTRDDF